MVVQCLMSVATLCARNAALVRRDELEQSLLKGLADSVLRIEVIDYAVVRMEEALRKGHEKLNAELERMRQKMLQLEAELARLVNAIAEGQPSQSFMTAIGERERELQAITNKLLGPVPGSLRATLDELRTFAVSRLSKIRELISHPESIDLARAVLAEHFGTSTLEPTIQDGEPVYLAHGKVDFFGDEAMTRTGGAGGPDLYIAVPGRNSRSKSQHERDKYLSSFGDQRCVRSLPLLPTRNRASS
jgi:hypothetical protein